MATDFEHGSESRANENKGQRKGETHEKQSSENLTQEELRIWLTQ